MSLSDTLTKISTDANLAENALGRVMTAAKRALIELEAVTAENIRLKTEIAELKKGSPASAPAPAPNQIDAIRTRSGTWRLFTEPSQGDVFVYRMTLDENPAFVRYLGIRQIATKEAGSTTALNMRSLTLGGIAAAVSQGAVRVVQNMEPVAPNAAWIREAVAAHVIPAYRRERAWLSTPVELLAVDPKRTAYDPTSLGPQPGSLNPPSSGGNYVGVTSAQGGEYSASRGFLHEIDARVVDAALHNEDSKIEAVWAQFTAYTLYSLAQPQGAQWSGVNHATVDPQFPAAGDRPWETPSIAPRPDIDTMQDVDQWGRDVAHLENTGFIHWLATEDPIAGLVVQRQAAYALASQHENYRANLTTYRARDLGQERSYFNVLSALWKSREVSRRITSVAGKLFWPLARTQKQMDEVIADLDSLYQAQQAASSSGDTTYGSGPYLDKIVGSVFDTPFVRPWPMKDGSTPQLTFASNFMSGQYGGVPLWLYAKAGNETVKRWLAAYAGQMIARFLYIGGALGVDCIDAATSSWMPTGPTRKNSFSYDVPAAPPFSDLKGWAAWYVSQPWATPGPRDSFNGSYAHTAMQMEAILLFAKDAGLNVAELDAALAKITETRARTTSLRNLQWLKHMHLPA